MYALYLRMKNILWPLKKYNPSLEGLPVHWAGFHVFVFITVYKLAFPESLMVYLEEIFYFQKIFFHIMFKKIELALNLSL